jgi:hypothetical protein
VIRAAVAVAAAALAAGCSSVPVVGSAPATRADDAPRVEDPAYAAALEQATRTGSVYDGLDLRVFGAATRQTPAFRRARVEVVARFLDLPEAERQARFEAERIDANRYLDFFVGFYTAERGWNELEQADSIWRIELEAGGATYLPLSVQRIERPDANLVALYPYLTPFWVAYRIRFPALDSAGARLFAIDAPALLRFASSAGRLELRFERDAAASAAP